MRDILSSGANKCARGGLITEERTSGHRAVPFLCGAPPRNFGQGCGVSSRPGDGDPCASGRPRDWRSDHVRPNIDPSRRDCGVRRVCACNAMRGGAALAQSRLAVGAIRVDVAPLRANAGDPTATWVEQELPGQLAEALSGRLTPKGATLVVRSTLSRSGRTRTTGLGTTSAASRRSGVSGGPCGRHRDIGLRRSIRRCSSNPITLVFRRWCARWRSGSREISDPACRLLDRSWRSGRRESAGTPPFDAKCGRLHYSAACAGSQCAGSVSSFGVRALLFALPPEIHFDT